MAKHKDKQPEKKQVESSTVFPQEDERFTIAIVGGGAAGIAAACAIGREARERYAPVRVVLLERGKRMGSSILRSGNGRCNFSHANIKPEAFNRPIFVGQVFEALDTAYTVSRLAESFRPAVADPYQNAVLQWFASLGLVWENNASGNPQTQDQLYPFTNKASTVLDVLSAELDRCGVECYCGVEVFNISNLTEKFSLDLADAQGEEGLRVFHADLVIYAAGGALAAKPQIAGVLEALNWIPPVPVLGPLQTETERIKKLDGARARVLLQCPARNYAEHGEVLFRTYGISGIVVFNASRFIQPGDVVVIDFAPNVPFDQLEAALFERSHLLARRNGPPHTYAELLRGFFQPELAEALMQSCSEYLLEGAAGMDAAVSAAGITHLARRIKAFSLEVTDYGKADQAQVTRGGIAVDHILPSTMESVYNHGFFVAGEALDVDGPCGGYNLHWAWASGLLAGLSAMQERGFRVHNFSDNRAGA